MKYHDCKIEPSFPKYPMLLHENICKSLCADILTCHIAPSNDMREQELAAIELKGSGPKAFSSDNLAPDLIRGRKPVRVTKTRQYKKAGARF